MTKEKSIFSFHFSCGAYIFVYITMVFIRPTSDADNSQSLKSWTLIIIIKYKCITLDHIIIYNIRQYSTYIFIFTKFEVIC